MWRECKRERVFEILNNDFSLYPTDSPVTREIIIEWLRYYPQCAATWQDKENDEEWANVVLVPLSEKGWQRILHSRPFRESDLYGDLLFRPQIDDKVAFHIYHVEKNRISAERSFRLHVNLCQYVNDFLIPTVNVSVLGFSAYCVTNDGIR